MDATLGHLDVAGTTALLASGRVSAVALVEEALARIAAVDRAGPRLNATAAVDRTALDQAAALDRHLARTGTLLGPLHGVTVVVKDCVETAGLATRFGCAALDGYLPAADATVVRRLRAAGAVLLAKTTMPDLATSLFGQSSLTGLTRHPYHHDHDPGGSSTGTAVAVAAGIGTVGVGTDNGGSVRVPASFCGLVGVRSTPGRISRAGTLPLVPLQDTVGPICRTVADAYAVFTVLEGPDPDDPLSLALGDRHRPRRRGPVRLGVLRQVFGGAADDRAAEVAAVLDDALGRARRAGLEVVDPVAVPDLDELVGAAGMFLLCARAALDDFLGRRPGLPVRSVAELARHPATGTAAPVLTAIAAGPRDPTAQPAYHRARTARDDLELALSAAMGRYGVDALVFPAARWPAPTRAEVDAGLVDPFTFPSNALVGSHSWLPSITVPVGSTGRGLPVGCEILTRRGDESGMFRAAAALERAVTRR